MKPGGEAVLSPEDSRHAAAVLRLKTGQTIRVGDGCGAVFKGTVISATPSAVRISLGEPLFAAEPAFQLTLFQALVKGEKLDLIVRQATELGVKRIVPVYTARSVPRWDERKELRRLARLRAISRGAAAQCRRAVIPAVEPVCSLVRAIAIASTGALLFPWEDEHKVSLGDLLRETVFHGPVSVFTGPEGGFTLSEAAALVAAGAIPVHLGPRILRSETAAAVACTLIQAVRGDLENGEIQ